MTCSSEWRTRSARRGSKGGQWSGEEGSRWGCSKASRGSTGDRTVSSTELPTPPLLVREWNLWWRLLRGMSWKCLCGCEEPESGSLLKNPKASAAERDQDQASKSSKVSGVF
jgi:hypothetical protein